MHVLFHVPLVSATRFIVRFKNIPFSIIDAHDVIRPYQATQLRAGAIHVSLKCRILTFDNWIGKILFWVCITESVEYFFCCLVRPDVTEAMNRHTKKTNYQRWSYTFDIESKLRLLCRSYDLLQSKLRHVVATTNPSPLCRSYDIKFLCFFRRG